MHCNNRPIYPGYPTDERIVKTWNIEWNIEWSIKWKALSKD